MVQLKTFISLAGALLASGALAHPGGEPELTGAQLESRAAEVKYASRALAACSKRHQVNGLSKRNIARRAAKAAGIRKARGIADRMSDFPLTFEETPHRISSIQVYANQRT